MSDEVLNETPETEPQAKPEEKVSDINTRLAALEKMYKEQKSINDGINRRNSTLEEELKAEKAAHMTDKERLEYEEKQARTALEKEKAELAKAKRDYMVTRALADDKLDPTITELMRMPDDDAGMDEWKATFNKILNATVEQRVNAILSGGPKPKSGEPPKPSKQLNTKEDAMMATPEEQLAYLEQEINK